MPKNAHPAFSEIHFGETRSCPIAFLKRMKMKNGGGFYFLVTEIVRSQGEKWCWCQLKKGRNENHPQSPCDHAAPWYRSTHFLSLGNIESFGTGGAFSGFSVDCCARDEFLGSGDHPSSRFPPRHCPSIVHDAINRIPPAPPLHFIPTSEQSVRFTFLGRYDGLIGPSHDRAPSLASMGSKDLLALDDPTPQ